MRRLRNASLVGFLFLTTSAGAQIVERDGVIIPVNPRTGEANRTGELQSYLLMGQVGIDEDGLLTVRSAAGVPARQLAEIRRAVSAENQRRKGIIDETLRKRGLPPEKRPEVAEELAAKWRNEAWSQWWVQRDDGSWRQGPVR